MSILTVRLNASDIKDIEFGIHYLNNKYFEKKVWTSNTTCNCLKFNITHQYI